MDRRADVMDVDSGSEQAPEPQGSAGAKAGDRFDCPQCGTSIVLNQAGNLEPGEARPFGCQCGAEMNRAD
jgi:hypothetical protein